MQNRELTMDDYLAMLRRRMKVILIPALLAPLATLTGCGLWENWFGTKKVPLPGKRETVAAAQGNLAVDEGVFVKTGADVLISVRHAIGGINLGQLHDEIKRRFLTLDQEERTVREMVAKMESGFVGRLEEFQHGS